MGYGEELVLICAAGCAVYLVAYVCARIWDTISESSKEKTLIDGDEDLGDVIVSVGSGTAPMDWNSFQHQHIVTCKEYPNHDEWTAREWNDFLKQRQIYNGRKATSVISVQDEDDVLTDFDSMFLDDQLEMHSRNGKVFKSIHPRTIYHMTRSDDSTDDFSVYKHGAIHYLATVEITNIGPIGGGSLFARTPVYFVSRHGEAKSNALDLEQIL